MRATHVIQRGGIYHFRRAVPSDLLHLLGRTEIWKSTNTRRHHDAMILTRRWSAAFDQLIFNARSGLVLAVDMKKAVAEYMDWVLDRHEKTRVEQASDRTPNDHLTSEESYEVSQILHLVVQARADKLQRQLATNRFDDETHKVAETIIRRTGSSTRPDTLEYTALLREIAAARITTARTESERYAGNYDTPYDLARRVTTPTEAASPPIEPDAPLLSELIEPYLKAKTAEQKLKPQTVSDKRRAVQQFVLIVEDKPANHLSATDITNYLGTMRELPASPATSDKYKGKTIPEMLSMNVEVSDLQAEGTIDKKYKETKSFCRWLKSNKHNPDVVTDEIRFVVSDEQKASDKKKAYDTPVDLEHMAIGLVAERIKLSKKGEVVPNKTFLDRPERFWLKLLALHCGFRLEEACQFLVTDIIQVDGIWCAKCDWFDDNGNRVKHLKNRNAKRTQPLHQMILDLGFLSFWRKIKEAGHKRLFHRLTPDKTSGKLQANFGNWYNGSKALKPTGKFKSPGFENIYIDDDPLKSFHSTRHTFCTALGHTDISERMLSDLMGHSKKTIAGKVYTKEQPIKAKLEAINRINYDVDFVAILGHWDDWH